MKSLLKASPAVVLIPCLIVAYFLSDLGYYAPEKGAIEPGEPTTLSFEVPRDSATVVVEARMSRSADRNPTVSDVLHFFALEQDTLGCTMRRLHGDGLSDAEIAARAAEPRELGSELELCLN